MRPQASFTININTLPSATQKDWRNVAELVGTEIMPFKAAHGECMEMVDARDREHWNLKDNFFPKC